MVLEKLLTLLDISIKILMKTDKPEMKYFVILLLAKF